MGAHQDVERLNGDPWDIAAVPKAPGPAGACPAGAHPATAWRLV
jgi:hypothetical protein